MNLTLLNTQCYRQISLIDIYKQYTMNDINVQSVMRCLKSKKLNNIDIAEFTMLQTNKFNRHLPAIHNEPN